MSFLNYKIKYLALMFFALMFLTPNVFAIAATNLTQLTYDTDKRSYGYPAWSPDGSKIVYSASSANSNSSLWVMNANGSHQVQITHGNGIIDLNPDWSPDGSMIAFERILGDGSSFIYRINSDGSNQKLLMGASASPTISPDGKYIAFDAGGVEGVPVVPEQGFGIYVMNVDGTNVKRLTDDFGDEVAPSWSPDGKKIVFTKDGTIQIMDSDGSNITSTGQAGYNARWSPDGKRIAFISERAGDMLQSIKLFHIYLMDTDGTNTTQLTFGDNRSDGIFDWSPDSTKIIFGSAVPPTLPTSISNLYIMTLDFNATPIPTATQTPEVTSTITSTATPTATSTPEVPGFSLLIAIVSLSILVLIKIRRG